MIQLDIEDLKSFGRVDDDTNEDPLVEDLQSAAEEYLENAGIAKDYERATYRLAIRLLVNHWNDNRSPVVVGTISKQLEYSLSSLISQLKNTQKAVT